MNGGLAVISDVLKTTVYNIGRLINGRREIIPEASFMPNRRPRNSGRTRPIRTACPLTRCSMQSSKLMWNVEKALTIS